MATPEPDNILTVTLNCGTCHTETPVQFNTGVPVPKLQVPYRATLHYECSGCHATAEVSIVLNQMPGPGQN
jgi:hypothetical protein